MATYLATVQIGRYRRWATTRAAGGRADPGRRAGRPRPRRRTTRLRPPAGDVGASSPGSFGAYPFPSYAVVVTDDELEIPLESQSLSTFGRNLVRDDWDAVRLVAHELAHQWFGNA